VTSHETRVGGPAISESLVCVDVTEAPRCVSLLVPWRPGALEP
jgi:hypothetical protein